MLNMDREPTFSNQTYGLVLEHINTAVVFLNTNMEVNYINPAAEMLFEVGRRKAIGKNIKKLIQIPELLLQRMNDALK